MGTKKVMCGLDRAIERAGGMVELALALGVAPKTLQRWRKEDPTMALRRAIAKAGSQGKLAAMLGAAQKTISEWARADSPPPPPAEPQNGVERAVRLAGGQPQLAKKLGVTQQNVSVWVRQGYVPASRAREIEIEYGVSRVELLSPKIRSAAGLGGEL